MKTLLLISTLWTLGMGGAMAASRTPTPAPEPADVTARLAVRDALVAEASLPEQAPALPDAASERAREVQRTTAFGQKGSAERAAHAQANEAAQKASSRASAQAANRAAQGAAAAAARNANADSHAAAGQARSEEARSKAHENGTGTHTNHGPPHLLH